MHVPNLVDVFKILRQQKLRLKAKNVPSEWGQESS